METLLSTVAQISFTIVSLFFVAVTLDSSTRDYWFGQYPQNRYVYINFLVMFIPGFLSLGGLVSVGDNVFPSWPYTGLVLFIYCVLIFFELRKLKKSPDYRRIANLEARLNISSIVVYNAVLLLPLSIFGFASAYVHDANNLGQQETLLKILICVSIFDSILPVIIFPRDFEKNKINDQEKSIPALSSSKHKDESRSTHILFALVVALIAFLVGKFYSQD